MARCCACCVKSFYFFMLHYAALVSNIWRYMLHLSINFYRIFNLKMCTASGSNALYAHIIKLRIVELCNRVVQLYMIKVLYIYYYGIV
jgi:hypothetical protein